MNKVTVYQSCLLILLLCVLLPYPLTAQAKVQAAPPQSIAYPVSYEPLTSEIYTYQPSDLHAPDGTDNPTGWVADPADGQHDLQRVTNNASLPADEALLNADSSFETVDIDKQQIAALPAVKEDLWQRIRNGFAMPNLTGPLVNERVSWYAARPDHIERMISRSSRYLFHIVQELERRKMPTELALLPFIESAFNPHAKSPAKAVGMWQFIPSTGKDFNLKQNIFQDERRDILASTRAALDYLQQLYDQFHDWPLALAAYNWGQGSVSKAIARNERAGLPADYMSLRMPQETRYYVPKLQAIKELILAPEQSAIELPPLENHPYFVTVTTARDIDINLAADLAELPLNEFKALNPSFNRPVIIGATRPKILLPFENAEIFQKNLSNHSGPLSSWTAVQTVGREKIGNLARRFGVSPQTVRSVNNIPKGMRLVPGSTIVIPRTATTNRDISTIIAENAKFAIEPEVKPQRKVIITARQKDTVHGIAARYGVSAHHLRSWNKLNRQQQLTAGKRLHIYVDGSPHQVKKTSRKVAKARASKKNGTILTSRHTIRDLD
jgi:membrane-bound lytic murein transglycosylase D